MITSKPANEIVVRDYVVFTLLTPYCPCDSY